TDQATGRDPVIEAGSALPVGFHVRQFAPAPAQQFHYRPLVGFLQVDRQDLVGFLAPTLDDSDPGLRPRHGQLVALAAHVLDQDRQVELAATRYHEGIGVGREFDSQGDIALELALESLAQLAAGDELALAPCHRRGVDEELHRHRRLVDAEHRQGLQVLGIAQGRPDAELFDAVDGDDVAGRGLIDHGALESGEAQYLVDLAADRRNARLGRIAIEDADHLAGAYPAAVDAADADLPHVAGIVERRNLELQGPVGIVAASGHLGENHVE